MKEILRDIEKKDIRDKLKKEFFRNIDTIISKWVSQYKIAKDLWLDPSLISYMRKNKPKTVTLEKYNKKLEKLINTL